MKTKTVLLSLLSLLVIGLAGCGSVASNTRNLLTTAGFREKTPETVKQKELYAAAPADKILRYTANGKTLYAYKDEKTGTALIGDQAAYQQFENLAAQQAARQAYQTEELRRDAAYGWYGAYGSPYGTYGSSLGGPPGVRYGAIR